VSQCTAVTMGLHDQNRSTADDLAGDQYTVAQCWAPSTRPVCCRYTEVERRLLLDSFKESTSKKTADAYSTYARKWQVGYVLACVCSSSNLTQQHLVDPVLWHSAHAAGTVAAGTVAAGTVAAGTVGQAPVAPAQIRISYALFVTYSDVLVTNCWYCVQLVPYALQWWLTHNADGTQRTKRRAGHLLDPSGCDVATGFLLWLEKGAPGFIGGTGRPRVQDLVSLFVTSAVAAV
jgi:hypothetical protein